MQGKRCREYSATRDEHGSNDLRVERPQVSTACVSAWWSETSQCRLRISDGGATTGQYHLRKRVVERYIKYPRPQFATLDHPLTQVVLTCGAENRFI